MRMKVWYLCKGDALHSKCKLNQYQSVCSLSLSPCILLPGLLALLNFRKKAVLTNKMLCWRKCLFSVTPCPCYRSSKANFHCSWYLSGVGEDNFLRLPLFGQICTTQKDSEGDILRQHMHCRMWFILIISVDEFLM